jgi:transcription elongation factor S-II
MTPPTTTTTTTDADVRSRAHRVRVYRFIRVRSNASSSSCVGIEKRNQQNKMGQDEEESTLLVKEIAELCATAQKAPDGEPARAVDALEAVLSLTKKTKETVFARVVENEKFAASGKIVNSLRKKHSDEGVRNAAAAVKTAWTELIVRSASKPTTAAATPVEGAETAKKAPQKEAAGDAGDDDAMAKLRADVKAKLTRVDDTARDRTREIFADALALCFNDGKVDGVTADALAKIADTIENAMSAKWPDAGKDYKAKVRQLAFNLKDPKNPDLRSSLADGSVSASVLIDLSPEELGSNERREANEKIREHAEWEAVRGQQQQASTDAFKCGKCKQRKCTYYQLQTRSADEPMTSTYFLSLEIFFSIE